MVARDISHLAGFPEDWREARNYVVSSGLC